MRRIGPPASALAEGDPALSDGRLRVSLAPKALEHARRALRATEVLRAVDRIYGAGTVLEPVPAHASNGEGLVAEARADEAVRRIVDRLGAQLRRVTRIS
jgi:hypothetical protein